MFNNSINTSVYSLKLRYIALQSEKSYYENLAMSHGIDFSNLRLARGILGIPSIVPVASTPSSVNGYRIFNLVPNSSDRHLYKDIYASYMFHRKAGTLSDSKAKMVKLLLKWCEVSEHIFNLYRTITKLTTATGILPFETIMSQRSFKLTQEVNEEFIGYSLNVHILHIDVIHILVNNIISYLGIEDLVKRDNGLFLGVGLNNEYKVADYLLNCNTTLIQDSRELEESYQSRGFNSLQDVSFCPEVTDKVNDEILSIANSQPEKSVLGISGGNILIRGEEYDSFPLFIGDGAWAPNEAYESCDKTDCDEEKKVVHVDVGGDSYHPVLIRDGEYKGTLTKSRKLRLSTAERAIILWGKGDVTSAGEKVEEEDKEELSHTVDSKRMSVEEVASLLDYYSIEGDCEVKVASVVPRAAISRRRKKQVYMGNNNFNMYNYSEPSNVSDALEALFITGIQGFSGVVDLDPTFKSLDVACILDKSHTTKYSFLREVHFKDSRKLIHSPYDWRDLIEDKLAEISGKVSLDNQLQEGIFNAIVEAVNGGQGKMMLPVDISVESFRLEVFNVAGKILNRNFATILNR